MTTPNTVTPDTQAARLELARQQADAQYDIYKNSGAKATYEAELAHRIENNIYPRYPRSPS